MPTNLALTGALLPGSRAEISAEMLDDFPAMVWVADANLQIVFVNRAWIAFTGRSIAVERGEAWKDGLFAPDREHVAGAIGAAMAERRSFSCEFRLRHQNGLHRWVCARGAPRLNARGEFVGYIAYCEEKKLEEVQERFVRISETTSDFVGMAAVNGDVLYMNRAGRQLLGWPLDGSLNGRKFSDVHPAWANEIVMHAAIPTAIREGTWAGETALLGADGREIPVSQVLISHAGADGTIEFLSTIIRDISDRKREEVARIEWANRYDAAIRASGQLLFDWNSFTNDITYAGDIESMLGYSMREMAGGLERFRQLIHPADVVAFDEEISRVTASRDPFHLRFRVVRKQGNAIDIEAKGYFFLDRQGHIGRMVGFFADVTAQVRAQEEIGLAHDNLEMRVAERTAELARTYVVIQDRALQQESVAHLGQRALAGAALEELFSEAASLVQSTLKVALCSVLELAADRAELVVRGMAGWPVSANGKRVPAGKLSQSGYTVLVQEPVIVEDMALETRFTVSQPVLEAGAVSGISVVIQADGAPMGVLCALTRERRSFTVDDVYFLRSITNILTAAIDRRAAEENIRAAKAQAEAANRAKSEFLSRMSHELRTPLNAILGFTQLLEIDDPSASQGESISHISRAGQHLLLLINEVLDIARIESGRLALAPEAIDVGEIVRGAVDLIRPLAARHAIELGMDQTCCSVPQVFADRQRLRQVLLNLLSNAVKYNRQAGKVAVSAEQMASDRLRISVRDTGHGIPQDKIARLFVPFERLGAEAGDIEGTGIGLALSQRIMNAMGGTIGVESVVDEGTTFWIELARMELSAQENAEACVSTGSDGNAFPGRTILYVEGQDLNVRLMEGMLSRFPEFRLLSAMQGGLAFDLAREHRPDLILLDLELPDMSGNEVLRRLKSDPALKHIPVVMVSEDATTELIDTLLSRGAHGHLAKPYRIDEFFRVLEEVLPS